MKVHDLPSYTELRPVGRRFCGKFVGRFDSVTWKQAIRCKQTQVPRKLEANGMQFDVHLNLVRDPALWIDEQSLNGDWVPTSYMANLVVE